MLDGVGALVCPEVPGVMPGVPGDACTGLDGLDVLVGLEVLPEHK